MSSDEEPVVRHGRREFVVAVGSIAAAAGLPAATAAAQGSTGEAEGQSTPPIEAGPVTRDHDDVADPADDATRLFLGPITPGTALGGFTVVAVHSIFRGAIPLVLEGHGHQVQLDVLAAGAGPAPLAEGSGLAIYGTFRSDVEARVVGQAAAATLAMLASRSDAAAPLGLLSFEARAQRHPYDVYSVLRD